MKQASGDDDMETCLVAKLRYIISNLVGSLLTMLNANTSTTVDHFDHN